jgi:poly-gamma-glutamate capsule biosynthesis protein CapA/YwtB (metallophosphatase superfamily)
MGERDGMPKRVPRGRSAPDAGAARLVLTAAVLLLAGVGAWVVIADDASPTADRARTGSSTTAAPSDPTTPSEAAAVPPTTSTTPARDPVLGSGQTVTVAFGGDTNFDGSNAARVASDPSSILAGVAPVLSDADLAVVNMETAIGIGGTPAPKEFTFQAPPAALEAYRSAGVDVVSAANNHGMDYGVESLRQTLQAEIDSRFPIIGIGANDTEAYAPFIADIRGQRVAVVAATQVLDGSLANAWTATPTQPGLASAKPIDRLVRAVSEARAQADTVVVFLHWGVERATCPTGDQQSLAQTLVDAGADIVVGGHAHRLQGGGRLGNAVVHYGLGNFAFGARTAGAARTGVLVVSITGRRVDGYQWLPGRISDRRPFLLAGGDAQSELAYWDGLRSCTNLTP